MNKPSRDWTTSLRIPRENTSDVQPALDPGWATAHGIHPGAELVLRMLRDEVLPLIRYLERRHGLVGYHFLVHDRQSGVPAPEGDNAAFIHLRLVFKKAVQDMDCVLPTQFEFTQPVKRTKVIGGLELGLVKKRNVKTAWELIDAQSRWVLDLIEAHEWKTGDEGVMLRQCQQYLHYFSNMLQMRVS